jgi:putative tricarboxylic transport membrane protein
VRSSLSSDLVAGLAIALFGAWFLWQGTLLRAGPGYAAIGPRVFPLIVGAGLLGSGLAILLGALAAPRERMAPAPAGERASGGPDRAAGRAAEAGPAEEPAYETDWRTLLGVAALLAAYVLLFRPLGFILTSAAFLPAGARILGSDLWRRDLLAGVLLSVATYAVFTFLLGLELPAGPLEAPIGTLRSLSGSGYG